VLSDALFMCFWSVIPVTAEITGCNNSNMSIIYLIFLAHSRPFISGMSMSIKMSSNLLNIKPEFY
jgi:hypothetical protein